MKLANWIDVASLATLRDCQVPWRSTGFVGDAYGFQMAAQRPRSLHPSCIAVDHEAISARRLACYAAHRQHLIWPSDVQGAVAALLPRCQHEVAVRRCGDCNRKRALLQSAPPKDNFRALIRLGQWSAVGRQEPIASAGASHSVAISPSAVE